MCQDISVYLVLCIGVLVAILAVFVNDHDKRLEALDSLSTHLGKRVENLTRENEKLTEIIEGWFVDYLKVGHAQVLNFQPPPLLFWVRVYPAVMILSNFGLYAWLV